MTAPWIRTIETMMVAMLVGCASSSIMDGHAGMGVIWGPVEASYYIPGIAERLATYDALVVDEVDVQTSDTATRSAARTFRWVLGAEFERLGLYPAITRTAPSNGTPLVARATVERYRESNSPDHRTCPDCEFDMTVRICDGRTGEVLLWRSVGSHADGTSVALVGCRGLLWDVAVDVAQWLKALKEGQKPGIGTTRFPKNHRITTDSDDAHQGENTRDGRPQ